MLLALGAAAALPIPAETVYRPDGSLRRDRPAPVYSADARDPWNRIFHLLYARRLRAQIRLEDGRWKSVTRLEGGDLPEFFFPPDARYLLEQPRQKRLRSALESELKSPGLRGRTREARILFQQDLWNRFDALHALAAEDARAQRLSALLARLVAKVALTNEELAGFRPGFAEGARSRPEVLDPRLFEAGSGWSELISTPAQAAGAEREAATTLHARRAGWRLVFRRFVRVPLQSGGEACLKEHLASIEGPAAAPPDQDAQRCGRSGLPPGTIALLLETPLALSSEGELHSLPLFLEAQARVVHPGGDFALLHLPRLAASGSPPRLTLQPLGAEELVPQLASVSPRSDGHPLVPMRRSCVICHGADGGKLGSRMMQVTPRTEVLVPGNSREEDLVLEAKRESGSFRALLKLFRGP
jgi:hypothetical protein